MSSQFTVMSVLEYFTGVASVYFPRLFEELERKTPSYGHMLVLFHIFFFLLHIDRKKGQGYSQDGLGDTGVCL